VPILEQVLEKNPDSIKIAFKHYPLKNHESALAAAAASLYADSKGKFQKFNARMKDNYENLTETKIMEIADELGLGGSETQKQFSNPILLRKIQKDIADGKKAGVRGVPKVFINGRPVKQRTLEGIQEMIDKELKNRS